ncbi:MAG: hypothetical protein AAB729_00265 [Patescibacteria group bacterium]
MKKQPTKNITLDDLALMVGKGFNGVNERFDKVDHRLGGVEKKLKDLEEGQEHIKLRLDSVAYRFELVEVQKRLERLETKAGIKYR